MLNNQTKSRAIINHTKNQTLGFLGMTFGCVMVLTVCTSAGCQKTALRPDDDRSQFDRYDQSRSQRVQPFLEDEFGRRTPNLSERLVNRGD